ncbi:MAG: peptide-methionine (S)-S-oxide reductase MsrA [Candidatus Moranbacteria bacterium]|nr:peptide-methionine (S)-S-oxide reductase MsrA [Candidatus Moranbacteria bacterium]
MKTTLLFALVSISLLFSIWYWMAHRYDEQANLPPVHNGTALAYFAGGCFWCTEADFEKLPGVTEVISGYSGGHTTDPTYEKVSSHTTGHLETVEVRYDPTIVSYEKLVQYFFSHMDPTDPNGQFADQGGSYRSAIFFQSPEEKRVAEIELERLRDSQVYDQPLVTALLRFEKFYAAEEYHQNYWKKNPTRYTYYRNGSGRNQYLEKICQIRSEKNIPCTQTR